MSLTRYNNIGMEKTYAKWLRRVHSEWTFDNTTNTFSHEAYGDKQFSPVYLFHKGEKHLLPFSEAEEDLRGLAFNKTASPNGWSYVSENRWRSSMDSYKGRKYIKYRKKKETRKKAKQQMEQNKEHQLY